VTCIIITSDVYNKKLFLAWGPACILFFFICFYFLALDGGVKPDVTSNVAVSDTKTQIGFTLPSVNPGEIGKIQ
jgi:hypothetical protein